MVPVLLFFMAALVAADEPLTEISAPDKSVSVVHCDPYTVCPNGTTCCRSPFGKWSCCPFFMVIDKNQSICIIYSMFIVFNSVIHLFRVSAAEMEFIAVRTGIIVI